MEKQESLKSSDRHNLGEFVPEVTGFSFLHHIEDENIINGLKFDIRVGKKSFGVKVVEGESKDSESESITSLSSGEKFEQLIKDRHQHFSDVQTQILGQAGSILALLDDIQSK